MSDPTNVPELVSEATRQPDAAAAGGPVIASRSMLVHAPRTSPPMAPLMIVAFGMAVVLAGCGGGGGSTDSTATPQAVAPAAVTPSGLLASVANGEGAAATFTTAGDLDTGNVFFKPLGNGRSCSSCHDQNGGWSITPDVLAARFDASNGTDPVFKLVDGANSPLAAVSTVSQRRAAYSMLLGKGLIRIGLPIPASAEFQLVAVDDPYGYASSAELSLFRRPLPTTNLKFVTAIMWDGRETLADAASSRCIRNNTANGAASQPARCFGTTDSGLLQQANSAVLTHAQATTGLTAAEQTQVVDFETALFTTQVTDNAAGNLTAAGAVSGPVALASTNFYFGINDVAAGDYRSATAFNPRAMQLFTAWLPGPVASTDPVVLARASIARGEQLFNTKRFTISGVAGFNDDIGEVNAQGTCTSCHSTPNVGTHSVPRFMNTGISGAARRTPDMPLYTLKNVATGETVQSTDPGLALQTGKWADIGKMKVPGLRGLESRSPYFHNGSENDITRLIAFYQTRFNINFTPQDVSDLAAFLKAL